MKMKKQLIVYLIMVIAGLLVLTLVLYSCGGTGQSLVSVEKAVPNNETGSPNVNNETHVVKIGFIGPISGLYSSEGTAARNAFQMAVDEANGSGRFPYFIELIIADDKSDDETAVAETGRILSDPSVVAVSGFWNSGPAAASIPLFIEAEVPLLIWGAIREALTNEYNVPWVTRSAPTDKQENIPLAAVVLDDLEYRDWFLVSDDSAYGEGNLEAFLRELNIRGITPRNTAVITDIDSDLDNIVRQIRSSRVGAVYCGSTSSIASLLKLRIYEAEDIDVLFCGISGIKTEDFLRIGESAAEGTLVVSPGIILEETESGRRFIEAYNARGYPDPIGAYTPYAYEAALIILNALSVCGEKPQPAEMADILYRSRTEGIMGTTTFNEIGQTTNVAAFLNVAQDGVWIPFQNSDYANGRRSFGGS